MLFLYICLLEGWKGLKVGGLGGLERLEGEKGLIIWVMVEYEVRQSKKSVGKAYALLMDKLSGHVTLLAKNGKPITSLMGIKRGLYRYKRELTLTSGIGLSPTQIERTPLAEELALLVGDVLDKFNVDVLESVEVGLIGEKELKRLLIKYDYEKLAKSGIKYKEIKKQLSEKYGVSVSSIEKLVYKKGT